MFSVFVFTIISVVVVSLVSLVGLLTLAFDEKRLNRMLIYLVSLSAGTLLGDAFIHLIPESYERSGQPIESSLFILLGILVFFFLEKVIHWRHCHEVACDEHPHFYSHVIILGDAVHNFIDGIIIAASFLVSVEIGIASTIAVILHEIPQEIGDFGSLIYAGFSRTKALLYNLVTAFTAVGGALVILLLGTASEQLTRYLIPLAAGGFIYIASSDLIPELKKQSAIGKSILQIIMLLVGIGTMLMLLYLE